MPEPLNTYETLLLDELKTHVAERPATTPRHPARWAVAAGVVAAATVGGVVATQLQATPAWAVEPHGDGSVTITVNRPTGARELERRLAELGITADVQFPTNGQHCAGWNTAAVGRDAEAGVTHAELGTRKVTITVVPSRAEKGATLVVEVATATVGGQPSMLANLFAVRGAAPACSLAPITTADVDPSHR